MRVPDFRLFAKYSQAFALVLCGMIIGAASYMIVYQHNMNELAIENDTLRREVKKMKEDIVMLEEYKGNNNVIKTIAVEIEQNPENPIDTVSRNEIIERVRKTFGVFKGKEIGYLADTNTPQIARMLFGEHRLSNIQGKDYTAEIRSIIVVYTELKVRIAVEEWRDKE